MSEAIYLYHSERERHCRSMAELASDAEVRSRHEALADLHAERAAQFSESSGGDPAAGEFSQP